ncbi:RlpA-like double-psi beta-barrel-protein domain-containing protein-containing protein [Naematelia encephala]|uniref:RlpA-like double-psi beta-barrel-protein domain-containing protein-containing protein n=1 Tax=Naematelia encephala TaxID=71784 RepID=A0A1Y2AQ19_9TREE|nr:RlpA-like double-psi beta-barrel-protein domain-containing protein-containing protein [Naematelia encephala]
MFKQLVVALLASSAALASPVPATEVKVEKRSSSGLATYFEVGLGACGWTNANEDLIVAINSDQYDNGDHCGKWLTIKNKANGKTVEAYAADECPSCDWGSLDLSPQVFGKLTDWDYDEGEFDITWWWND